MVTTLVCESLEYGSFRLVVEENNTTPFEEPFWSLFTSLTKIIKPFYVVLETIFKKYLWSLL